jgi:hypothetical protein
MKPLFIVLLVISCWFKVNGQEIGLNFNYQLIEAKEWNKATQVYNLSRPFLENKQPLLRHGMSFGFYYLRNPENRLSWGPSISFSFFRSSSENPNFDIDIHSLLVDLGAKIQYRPELANNNLNLSFTPNLTLTTLNRQLNGEVVIIGETEEDQPLRSYGLGLGINTQVSYDYVVKDNWIISPMLGANYYPYLWASRSEVVFNESAAGDLKSSTSIIGLQGGVILKRRK